MPIGNARRQAGYTYLFLLFAVAIGGLVLAATGQVWHTQAVREKEAELLFAGGQYRRALASYHRVAGNGIAPGGEWPRTLEDLVSDGRCIPLPCRHLRRGYRDPLTGGAEWGLVKAGGRIVGVFSLAGGEPIKKGGFADADGGFAGAGSYRQWRFVDPAAAPRKQDPAGQSFVGEAASGSGGAASGR